MSFGKAIRTCLSKYATFSGRARRSEYWFFALFLIIVGVASYLIEVVADARGVNEISLLVLLLPSFAVLVRRLHDIDRSGWWALLPFVPILIALIMLEVLFSTVGFLGPPAGGYLGPVENQVPTGPQPVVVWPWLAVSFIVLIALIIWIILLVWACTRGTPGPNRFGHDPFAI
jgi:uncharacterized membrane protein YhaH (DUF805 family)